MGPVTLAMQGNLIIASHALARCTFTNQDVGYVLWLDGIPTPLIMFAGVKNCMRLSLFKTKN